MFLLEMCEIFIWQKIKKRRNGYQNGKACTHTHTLWNYEQADRKNKAECFFVHEREPTIRGDRSNSSEKSDDGCNTCHKDTHTIDLCSVT